MPEYKYQRSHTEMSTKKGFKKKQLTYPCAGPGVEREELTGAQLFPDELTLAGGSWV